MKKDYFKNNIPKAKVYKFEGTYLMWINLTFLKIPQKELLDRLMECGVLVGLLTDMYERIFQEGVFPSEYPLWQESLSDLWGDGYGSADRLRLLCESKDGALVYGEDNGCLPDINKVEKIEKRVAVFPNPTNNIVIIEGVIADEVKIYNTFGQLVKTVTDSNEIDMDGLAEGVYLLKVTDKEGAIHTGKVMKKSK